MCKVFKYLQRVVIFIARNTLAIFMRVVFSVAPIQKNKVFMMSYSGTKYSCNPKALTEYMLKNDKTFEIVWGFSKQYIKGIQLNKSVIKVAFNTLKFFYHYYTAKFIIYNMRLPYYFLKRKKQYYVQTWHNYLAFKAIEKEAESMLDKSYLRSAKSDSKKMNLLLSSSKFTTEQYKNYFWYNGEILEKGTPRNDILFKDDCNIELKNEIKKELDLENKKIVLYAPTFRNNEDISFYTMESEKLLDVLNERFGKEWFLLYRLHPNLLNKANSLNIGNHAKNVSSYNDMQHLLLIADILITDFSSSSFDYMFTNKPCFLYLKDLDKYLKDERPLTIDLNKLPFPVANTFKDLIKSIHQFDNKEYFEKIKKFNDFIGNYEDGNACKELVKVIKDVMKK